MPQTCLDSLTPSNLRQLFADLEEEEIAKNANYVLARIKSMFARYVMNGLPCPSYVCMNDHGVYNTMTSIHPSNLHTLNQNGFKVYKVRFYKQNMENTFKEFITWGDINFEKEVYMPFYGHLEEKTDFVEVCT